jgi:hypothetical protein
VGSSERELAIVECEYRRGRPSGTIQFAGKEFFLGSELGHGSDGDFSRGWIQDVGFIGLGNMGSRMAANLLKAGHRLTVHDRHVSISFQGFATSS